MVGYQGVWDPKVLTPQEALDIYERHFRHIDEEDIDPDDLAFINTLRTSLENNPHVYPRSMDSTMMAGVLNKRLDMGKFMA